MGSASRLERHTPRRLAENLVQCCENYFQTQKVSNDSFSGDDLKERSNELRLSLRITSC